MKNRLVSFLKQAKNRGSDWSFRGNAIACEFPHRCRLLKKSVRLIAAENKRTQLCLQTELAEEKSQSLHLQKLSRWAQQIYVTKEKVVTLDVIKKFCMQARNWLEIFWQTQARARFDPKSPARLITLHHVKSCILRVLLAWRHKNIFGIKSNCTTVNWQKSTKFHL